MSAVTWSLLGASGAIGAVSLVGVGLSTAGESRGFDDGDGRGFARARTLNAASWLGLGAAAGLGLTTVVFAGTHTRVSVAPDTVTLNTQF